MNVDTYNIEKKYMPFFTMNIISYRLHSYELSAWKGTVFTKLQVISLTPKFRIHTTPEIRLKK